MSEAAQLRYCVGRVHDATREASLSSDVLDETCRFVRESLPAKSIVTSA
jgi:hypothetical protein